MKKVYQTIVDSNNGNCMQAVIASLLEKELDEVPHFLENYYKRENGGDVEDHEIHDIIYLWKHGYRHLICFTKHSLRGSKLTMTEVAKLDGGMDGYFYACVPSQTFKDITHAVIVNTNLEVVHDPNPNQLAFNCKPEDIEYIYTVNDWVLDDNGNFKKGENYVEPNP